MLFAARVSRPSQKFPTKARAHTEHPVKSQSSLHPKLTCQTRVSQLRKCFWVCPVQCKTHAGSVLLVNVQTSTLPRGMPVGLMKPWSRAANSASARRSRAQLALGGFGLGPLRSPLAPPHCSKVLPCSFSVFKTSSLLEWCSDREFETYDRACHHKLRIPRTIMKSSLSNPVLKSLSRH
jgi:hypothetical protein